MTCHLPRVYDPVVTDHAVLAEGRETWLAAGATAIHAHQIGVTLIAEKGRVITVKPQTKRGVEP